MPSIDIYTRPLCGFCLVAKRLLDKKGAAFTEVDIGQEPERRAEMVQRSGGRNTFPQIFIGETHVGGCDELLALERDGKLDGMLQGA